MKLSKKVGVVALGGLGLWCLAAVGRMGGTSSSTSSPATVSQSNLQSGVGTGNGVDPEHPYAHLVTDAERTYAGAALGFLQTVLEQDSKIAVAMDGASKGEVSLLDVKDAVKHAQFVQDAGYLGDYKPAEVPPSLTAVAAKIERCRKLHDSAFRGMLEYYKTSNLDHLQSGVDVLGRGAALTNECIGDLNRWTESVKERGK